MASDPELKHTPGTEPLTWDGDIASRLVDGVDSFLLRKLTESIESRSQYWTRDCSSTAAYAESVEPNRQRLAHILGVRDARPPAAGMSLVGTTAQQSLVGRTDAYEVHAVRWPAFGDVNGEGLLLQPIGRLPIADIVAVPDVDQTPEQIVGLIAGVAVESQYPRRLVESGCRVIVPALIDRTTEEHDMSRREFLYRSAFELGRHLIGYEVQKILAAADWFEREAGDDARPTGIGITGWGEGGLLALYAGALDARLTTICVSGYFDSRQDMWQEPIERNIFGLLEQFGDAELASLIAPRSLIVEAAAAPDVTVPPGGRAAPGRLTTPDPITVSEELERARKLVEGLDPAPDFRLIISGDGSGPCGCDETLQAFLEAVSGDARLAVPGAPPPHLHAVFDPDERQQRLLHELDRHNQWLLRESPKARDAFFEGLDCQSLETFEETIEPYREHFAEEIIGRFDDELLPFNARSRLAYDEPDWQGYEIVLDVFEDVIAYGILLLPRDLDPEERRPVVVCQHGLNGRCQDVIAGDAKAKRVYGEFAVRLCERGFITFAPQNLYLFGDRFRTLQRKANPLKKTLYSIMVPQHQQILNWLKTQPHVDPERIAFYGLSYGGKTAMRVPPLVSDYCLSICSADFNEWVWKNAATWSTYSYVFGGEYEIFEFDLGSTFNYAEMSRLICPRPFMVERGHFDGVAPDETVAYEYAKTQRHYDLLGIGDRTEMEVFVGPHSINGVGTFEFLHSHLDWPQS